MTIDYKGLAELSLGYQFACGIRLQRGGPGDSWFVSDRNGWRLDEGGIFIGCPAPAHIKTWIEGTSFTFEGALKALSRRSEVREQLAKFLPRPNHKPAS